MWIDFHYHGNPMSRYYFLYFKHEETEASKRKVSDKGADSQEEVKQSF